MSSQRPPIAFSTGSPPLDDVLEELRAGDNVVFYADDPADYGPFVATALCYAQSMDTGVVYGRASGALDSIMVAFSDVAVVNLDELPRRDDLAESFREVAETFGPELYYFFDPLPDLEHLLGSERDMRDFFLNTCPRLFQLRTVAYWALPSGLYSDATVAAIKDCTQVFLEVAKDPDESSELAPPSAERRLIVTPVKVWGRYSEEMFHPHLLTLDQNDVCVGVQPLGSGRDDAYIEALAAKNRELAEIRDALHRSNETLTIRNRDLARLNERLGEQSRLYESLSVNLDHLLALLRAGQDIGSSLVVDQVRRAILTASTRLFGVPACRLCLSPSHGLGGAELVGGTLPTWTLDREPDIAALRYQVLGDQTVRSLLIPFLATDVGSVAIAPVMLRDACIGTLELLAEDGSLDAEEPRTLLRYLASEASIALDNARLYREVALQREQLRTFVDQVITSEEQESRRFAFDLHDGLVQSIVAAFQHLQTAQALRSRDPRSEEAELAHGVRLLQQSIYEARRLISQLRPAGLDDFGLLHALRLYVSQIEADHPWRVTLDVSPRWGSLPASLEAALFRIIQEATTNARKYADASRVRISLQSLPERIQVSVQDWGVGFDPEAVLAAPERGMHIGLIGIRERARLWGGTCDIASKPRQGTVVTISIPRDRIAPQGDDSPVGALVDQRATRDALTAQEAPL